MSRRLPLVLLSALLVASIVQGDDSIPAKKLDEMKAATVYVKVDGGQWAATGSGFLIRADEETGMIVTNHHVIDTPRGRAPGKISLVFWSGTKKERVLPAEIVGTDADRDLAILKVSSKELPKALDLSQKPELHETMTVYTFGFPLGDLLSLTKGNPAMTIGKGTVSSIREDEQGKVKAVQLDCELNPGNSGGPVIDAEGRLIGVAVAKVRGTKLCFAIPASELTAMVSGRISGLGIELKKVENGEVDVLLAVESNDPLNKISKVEVRYLRQDALKEEPKANEEGIWPELPGAEKVALKIEGQKASALLQLKSPEKKRVDYWFQRVYVNGEGKPIVLAPERRSIDFGTGLVARTDVHAATELDGLLAYWKLDERKDETVEDSSSNKMKATLHGGRWVEGVSGTALQFDKAGEYLDLGDSPKFNFKAGQAFTFAGWVKTKAKDGSIVSLRNSKEGAGGIIDLTLGGGKLGILVLADGGKYGEFATLNGGAVDDGEWHHFAVTRDTGKTIELFIDGVSQGKATGTAAGGPITTDLRALGSERFWAKSGGGNPQLIGAVDEFCVFDRALGAKEIDKLAGRQR
jgi:hypothetical protein